MTTKGWKKSTFGEAAIIANGQVDPKVEPFLNYRHVGPENITSGTGRLQDVLIAKELGLISGKYLFDDNAIVYSKIRPNLNKVCIPGFVGICSADMYPVWAADGVDRDYLFQYMLSGKFVKDATAVSGRTGLPKINREDLNRIAIPLPPLAEQRKIAAILGTWDAAIDRAERLVAALKARKKALMQRLLTGEMRFPGFGETGTNGILLDGWQEYRLDQIFKRVQRPASEPEHVLSITAKVGFVDQAAKFGRIIAGKTLERYTLLRKGEFAYNKGNSGSYPQGCIYRLEEFDEGAVPNVYYCFAPKRPDVDSDFYKFYFESGALNRQLSRLINSGVRNDGLLNLSAEEFFGIKVLMPPPPEQAAVGSVLTCADNEIGVASQNLAALRAQKRGLMQRLLTGEVRVAVDG